MKVKMFEIRDAGTCIPVIAIRVNADTYEEFRFWKREGFNCAYGDVILVRPENELAKYDPYHWNDRTMMEAHLYIRSHFDELPDCSVVDVRCIVGETSKPADSEIWS